MADQMNRRVSGFLENGIALFLVAAFALMFANFLAGDTDMVTVRAVVVMSLQAAFRVAFLMIIVQAILEMLGREKILLRPDWQRFGGFITGLAMLACGGALLAAMVPLLVA